MVTCLMPAADGLAQSLEVVPFGGYRFGGDFYELVTGESVDVDGAGSFGVVLNIPYRDTLQIEGYFTHQEAHFTLPASVDAPPTRWRVTVDHVHAGGLRELRPGRVRPFLTGTLGLTRYASAGDNEVRFAAGAGGGAKLFPVERAGLRLDARVIATVVDAAGDSLACAPRVGICAGTLNASMVWQAEFSAGLVVRLW